MELAATTDSITHWSCAYLKINKQKKEKLGAWVYSSVLNVVVPLPVSE